MYSLDLKVLSMCHSCCKWNWVLWRGDCQQPCCWPANRWMLVLCVTGPKPNTWGGFHSLWPKGWFLFCFVLCLSALPRHTSTSTTQRSGEPRQWLTRFIIILRMYGVASYGWWPRSTGDRSMERITWKYLCWMNWRPGKCLWWVLWIEMCSQPQSIRKWAQDQADLPFYRCQACTCMGLTHASLSGGHLASCQGPVQMLALGAAICTICANRLWLVKSLNGDSNRATNWKKCCVKDTGHGCSQELPQHM